MAPTVSSPARLTPALAASSQRSSVLNLMHSAPVQGQRGAASRGRDPWDSRWICTSLQMRSDGRRAESREQRAESRVPSVWAPPADGPSRAIDATAVDALPDQKQEGNVV